MRWFKHMVASSRDEKLAMLRAEFGMEGYGLYWLILELLAEKVNEKNDTSLTYSAKIWKSFTGISVKKFQKFLSFCSEFEIFSVKFEKNISKNGQNGITISCPNLLKYRDEWSKRKARNSGVTTKQLRCKDTDTDTEKDNYYCPKPEKPGHGPEAESSESGSTGAEKSVTVLPEEKPKHLTPVVLKIPLVAKDGEFEVRQADVDGWQEAFPGVDVLASLRVIQQWNISSPERRKTRRGVRRHITGWLAKDQDQGRNRRKSPGYQSPSLAGAGMPIPKNLTDEEVDAMLNMQRAGGTR